MVTDGLPGRMEGGLGMASRTINIPATTNLDADELTSGTVPTARLGTGWHHIAVRASGSSPTSYSIFVDGTEIASTTSSQSRANSGNDLHLGRRTASSGQRGRSGRYAGLYLCPSALSDARIAAHATAGLA